MKKQTAPIMEPLVGPPPLFNEGVWFQSACSGLWYQVLNAGGDISAVKIDGVIYKRNENMNKEEDSTVEAVVPDGGLGVNRLGNAILCYAWGETDRPDVFLAKSSDDVRQFIIEECVADGDVPFLGEVMNEMANHDWREDGELKYEFEIGGLRFEDVTEMSQTKHYTFKH